MSVSSSSRQHDEGAEQSWALARARGLPDDGLLIRVDVARQRLQLMGKGLLKTSYAVSTSRLGIGASDGSHKTPPGLHEVSQWIGAGAEPGTVFRGRKTTGASVPETRWRGQSDGDLILTRILRLAGIEDGVNRGPGVDTFERYIYIHGTNHEHLLGQPASGGCIRMGNRDVLDLFERTKDKTTWCWIG
jgi:UDP-N-acetylmuramate--alanine ligase